MDSAELWRWLWLVLALGAITGEIAMAGTFFLLPFAIGAGVAAVVSFVGVAALGSWAVFLGVTVASFLALRPLARRMDRTISSTPVGAQRLVGQSGFAIGAATTVEPALVRVAGEEWMAWPAKAYVPAGSAIEVVGISGTHLVIAPRGEATSHFAATTEDAAVWSTASVDD